MRPLEWVMLSVWTSVLRSCWRCPVHQLEQSSMCMGLSVCKCTSVAYVF